MANIEKPEPSRDDCESSYLMTPVEIELFCDNPRGEPLEWGVAPLSADCEIAKQQNDIRRKLQERFDQRPDGVPKDLADFVEETHLSHSARREEFNRFNYFCRAKESLDDVGQSERDIINRAESGQASPADLLYVQKLLGIASIELGNVTHPYGNHAESIEPMRQAIAQAVRICGGKINDEPRSVYEAFSSDNLRNPDKSKYLSVTCETVLGELADGIKVIERNLSVLQTEAIDRDFADDIKSIEVEYGEESYKSWRAEASSLCQDIIPRLRNSVDSTAIVPVSTVIIARNKELEKKNLADDNVNERWQKMLGYGAVNSSKDLRF